MVERVIERVKQAKFVDQVVVASAHPLGIQLDVPIFYGDEEDVLNRYYKCADLVDAEIIVRITADCPLIDPEVIDMALSYFYAHDYPYVYFAPVDGLDVEVFTFEILKEANLNAVKEEREHVTPYMKRKTKLSVDTKEELERVRKWIG